MDAPSTSSSPTSPSTTPTSAPAHSDPSLLLFLAHSPPLAPALSPSPTQHPLSVANLLRSSTSSFSSTSTSPFIPSATPSSTVDQSSSSSSFGFVSRVAAIPVVNSITSFYEQSKSSSPLIRVSLFLSSHFFLVPRGSLLPSSCGPRGSPVKLFLLFFFFFFFLLHFFFTFSRADNGSNLFLFFRLETHPPIVQV